MAQSASTASSAGSLNVGGIGTRTDGSSTTTIMLIVAGVVLAAFLFFKKKDK